MMFAATTPTKGELMSKTMSRILLTACFALTVVGTGCSSSNSNSAFCEAFRNRNVSLAVKNADGNVDTTALQASFDHIIKVAPKNLKADVTYLTEVIGAYVKVQEHSMTRQQFAKLYPNAKTQAAKDRVNAYLKPNCKFTV